MSKEAQNSNKSTLIVCHYPGLDSTSDWLCHKETLLPPIRTTTVTQIRAVRRHQYFCAFSSRVDSQGNLRWHHKMLANGTVVIIICMLAWENSKHLVMLPLVSAPNDIWEMSAEIRYWRRITTQIWVMMPHQYGISALVYKTSLGGETSGSVTKWLLFSQAISMSTYSKWICLLPGDWCPPWRWTNSLRKGLGNSN